MEKTLEILKHIEELYADKVDEAALLRLPKQKPEQFEAWKRNFEDFDLTDVLNAIDRFWDEKNNRVRPKVAQIKALLSNRNAKKEKNSFSEFAEMSDKDLRYRSFPEQRYFDRDVAVGKQVRGLVFYKKAFWQIIQERVDTLPAAYKMTRSEKIEIAERNGYFDDITDVVENIFKADMAKSGVNKYRGINGFKGIVGSSFVNSEAA